jgi:hypothetical protein
MSEHGEHVTQFERIRQETHAARVGFLHTEIQTGNALLDTAATRRRDETRERTRALAREAYDVVTRVLVGVEGEHAELTVLHARLGARLGEGE